METRVCCRNVSKGAGEY
uniref:Uncharacterized protein n=1 Tax=Arundo donax TaxID=35708 RepID=A0A0A9HKC8_ARUDO